MDAFDGGEGAESYAFQQLFQIEHVVGQEDHDAVVAGIGLPPAAIGPGPADGADGALAAGHRRVVRLQHDRDAVFLALGQTYWVAVKPKIRPDASFAELLQAMAEATIEALLDLVPDDVIRAAFACLAGAGSRR